MHIIAVVLVNMILYLRAYLEVHNCTIKSICLLSYCIWRARRYTVFIDMTTWKYIVLCLTPLLRLWMSPSDISPESEHQFSPEINKRKHSRWRSTTALLNNCGAWSTYTAKKIWIYVFPGKELRGLIPNFHIYVSVSDLRIFPRSVHLFSCSKLGRSIRGIYKSVTETWM